MTTKQALIVFAGSLAGLAAGWWGLGRSPAKGAGRARVIQRWKETL